MRHIYTSVRIVMTVSSARFCIVILVLLLTNQLTTAELNVKFVNVIFRHGDRTPGGGPSESFPTNPYANSTFEPYGRGQLTNKGKRRAYDLGVRIRNAYNDFLGEIYYPPAIFARSTAVDRTKMSLQLVLAGIFPPTNPQKWHPQLNWQPVATSYVPRSKDVLLIPRDCPKFKEAIDYILSLPEIQDKISKYDDLMKNLTEWTGKTINSTRLALGVYNVLMSLSSLGLELPEWTAGIFPNGLLMNVTGFHFEIYSYNQRINTLNGGVLLKDFIKNMETSINNKTSLKMALYSAHEVNIASILGVLGVYEAHMPEYSSAVIVELLEDNSGHFVRIYYDLGIPPERRPIDIPGCGELCRFEKFVELYQNVLPTDEDLICRKN